MKKFLRIIIFLAALVVFIFCAFQLFQKFREYKESEDTYKKISEAVKESPEDPSSSSQSTDSNNIQIDWEKFRDTDIVAWLQLGAISYPVMQDTDNNFYIHHLPDKTYNYGGSLFLQAENNFTFTDQNSIIYGHNMANGSMFGNLKKYASADFSNFYFKLYLPDGTCHTYSYLAVIHTTVGSDVYTYGFKDKEEFMNYQKKMQSISSVDCTASPDPDKNLVTLSTCNGPAGTSQRLDIIGIERNVEKVQNEASWYQVKLKKRDNDLGTEVNNSISGNNYISCKDQ